MLEVGRERAAARHLDDRVTFVEGNAEALAFPDRAFDAYTIAFGIRNVPRIDRALTEAFRVLRPGTSTVENSRHRNRLPGLSARNASLNARSIRGTLRMPNAIV